MKVSARVHPKYPIISAELLADLGSQFVALTLVDLLIFRGERALSNLVLLCLIEQTPSVFLSPLAGLWIDRIGPRKWIAIVNACKGLLAGLLALISSSWVIFPAYLCFIIGSLFFYIGRLSITRSVIPRDEIISFNSLNERVSLAASILGPWVIGCIVLKTGQGFALGLAGILFALSACAILGLRKAYQVAEGPTPFSKRNNIVRPLLFQFKEPLRSNDKLRPYFLIFGFVLLGGGVLNIGLPILFKTNFGKNVADWGLILSGFQAGSCVSTFLLPRCSERFKQETILSVSFIILAGAMAIVGHLATYIQLALLMVVFGCGLTLMHVFLESLIQQNSSKVHVGKTMSLLTAYRGACYLGTILSSALVLRLWGPKPLLLVGSLMMVSASLLARGVSQGSVARVPLATD